jgi:hypothetical protein
MRTNAIGIMAVMLLALGLRGAVAAQNGTPAAGTAMNGSCAQVQPRDAAFFRQLPATPAAQREQTTSQAASPAASPAPFAMPEGTPADDATVAAVGALYQELIDCLNQGDYLRAYALYTDNYLQRNLSAEAIAKLAATPVPTEEAQQSAFGSVLDARQLDDGRVAALVTTANPQTGETVIFSILVRDGETLRIDEEQVVESAVEGSPAAGGAGTPAA